MVSVLESEKEGVKYYVTAAYCYLHNLTVISFRSSCVATNITACLTWQAYSKSKFIVCTCVKIA